MKHFLLVFTLFISLQSLGQTTDVVAAYPCATGKKQTGLLDMTLQSVLVEPNHYQQLGLQFKYTLLKTDAGQMNVYAPALYFNVFHLLFGPSSNLYFNCNPGYYFASVGTHGLSLNYGLLLAKNLGKGIWLLAQVTNNHLFNDHVHYLSPGAGIRFRF